MNKNIGRNATSKVIPNDPKYATVATLRVSCIILFHWLLGPVRKHDPVKAMMFPTVVCNTNGSGSPSIKSLNRKKDPKERRYPRIMQAPHPINRSCHVSAMKHPASLVSLSDDEDSVASCEDRGNKELRSMESNIFSATGTAD